jgi:hypothetical protein
LLCINITPSLFLSSDAEIEVDMRLLCLKRGLLLRGLRLVRLAATDDDDDDDDGDDNGNDDDVRMCD